MKLRDKYGWPLEMFSNRPVINFFRYLILTDVIATWRYRNWDGTGTDPGPVGNCQQAFQGTPKEPKNG